uniref:Uncharacterized protein n=1 Tax=Oryza rufipogon TaxID=4529 RepID=A0A1Y8Z851_ORYRU
MAQDESN